MTRMYKTLGSSQKGHEERKEKQPGIEGGRGWGKEILRERGRETEM